jgi:ribosome-binding protein aMBF1 (putative translation factor)
MKCTWIRRKSAEVVEPCGNAVGERGRQHEVRVCDDCFGNYAKWKNRSNGAKLGAQLRASAKRKKKHKPKHGRGAQARSKPARYV